MSGVRNQDHVLDSNAAETRNVHARFDSYNMAGGQHILGIPCKSRSLVDLETDSMSRAVKKLVFVPVLAENLPTRLVDIVAGNSWADAVDPCLL